MKLITERIEKENEPAEWRKSASLTIKRSRREKLAQWLSNPLISVQSCRLATEQAARAVLDDLRRAAARPEPRPDGARRGRGHSQMSVGRTRTMALAGG